MTNQLIIWGLKTRPDFLAVARGRRHATAGLVLQARRRPESTDIGTDIVRIGFTATKKTGNAVHRNRIKRRLRAAAREILPENAKSGFDYVLVGRAGTFDRPWQSLLDDLTSALQMVHQPSRRRRGPKKGPHKASGNEADNTGDAQRK